MDFKIRKLKTVGLRQNAPQARSMSIRAARLHQAVVALAGFSLLAFAVALIVLPRPAVAIIPLSFALALLTQAGDRPRPPASAEAGC
jgi:hypothetical protein